MSHTMDPNLPNGVPPHLNGLESHSSHSSRDSSPSTRMFPGPGPGARTISSSQLPPSKMVASQVTHITNKYSNLNIGGSAIQTPQSSLSLGKFNTSTPETEEEARKQRIQNFNQTSVLSPISEPISGFTHSANSYFSNLPAPSKMTENQVNPQLPPSSQSQGPSQPLAVSTQVPSTRNSMAASSQPPIRPAGQSSAPQPGMMAYNPAVVGLSSSGQPNTFPPQRFATISNQNGPVGQMPATNGYKPPNLPMNANPVTPHNNPLPTSQMAQNPSLPHYPQAPFVPNTYANPIRPPLIQSAQNPYQQRLPVENMPPHKSQPRTSVHTNRYPAQVQPTHPNQNYTNVMQKAYPQPKPQYVAPQATPQQLSGQPYANHQQQPYNYQSSVHTGFNKLWGTDNYDLLQTPNILPPTKLEAPQVSLGNPAMDEANCSADIFRCTMTRIPESNALLQKSRLPLGILIHPFKDLNHLPVIQCNTIVRCRACRTYINPFVFFVDNKRWKCNLCYRVNELPEEFQYDPLTKTYGDPSRRPEVKTSTIEYIAPAEYMLRPPQPAVYLYLFDVSRAAVESGYLQTACATLSSELENLPGDARTHIGFIAFDSALHFYSLADGLNQPHEMTVMEIDDIFLPCPDNLLVNLKDRIDLVSDLLAQLPSRHSNSFDTGSALGAALQAAHKMMASTGGRITVFQSSLPSIGPGALSAREDPSNRASGEVLHLNPAIDFYKRLALECSGQQIAVDLFVLNSQYVDIATISGISRFSGGCIHHFPLFKASRDLQNGAFEKSLRRYLSRKIGFEAVMRIRCTRGLTIHTFHGNFFVRSTDLLSLPNVNPDAGYGMQVAIEEHLSDIQNVCFQAALLYTSSKGERRIRVHTLCLPVATTLADVISSADQQCIVGLLAKMAVDRSMQSNLADAREAFINVAIDILSSYKLSQNMSASSGLTAPRCLKLLPLYISALLKSTAFRSGVSTRLDDRVKAMCDMKTRPLPYLIQTIYPDLYPVHNLHEQMTVLNDEEEAVHMPPILQLSARSIDSSGAYLLDMCEHMILFVCPAVAPVFLNQVLGVADYNSITDSITELPVLDNEHNNRMHMFIRYLNEEKPTCATIQIIRENSPLRGAFIERLIEDRIETALSYHEFLQHLKTQVK